MIGPQIHLAPLPWNLQGLELFAADGTWITTFNTGTSKRQAEAEFVVRSANTHDELALLVGVLALDYHTLSKHALSFNECEHARCVGSKATIVKAQEK